MRGVEGFKVFTSKKYLSRVTRPLSENSHDPIAFSYELTGTSRLRRELSESRVKCEPTV